MYQAGGLTRDQGQFVATWGEAGSTLDFKLRARKVVGKRFSR